LKKKKVYDDRRKEMNKNDEKDEKDSNKKKLNELKSNFKVNFLLIIIYVTVIIIKDS